MTASNRRMSSISWLDYSDGDRRRMLDVVDLFRERDTRDELGLGSVRDAFADAFFPGTSTIMTRARYFLLVPWTYQRLEDTGVSSAEIARRARQAELNGRVRQKTIPKGQDAGVFILTTPLHFNVPA